MLKPEDPRGNRGGATDTCRTGGGVTGQKVQSGDEEKNGRIC